jgi:hypothetical protein
VPLLFNRMILLRIAGSKVSSVRFKGFWGRGMTGTKVPLKIIPTHQTPSASRYKEFADHMVDFFVGVLYDEYSGVWDFIPIQINIVR